MKQKGQFQKGAALALLLALSSFLLLAGCKADKDLPFYHFESIPKPVLIVDGVRYIEDSNIICYQSFGSGLFWNFTGEIGDVIGVCGNDVERGGGYDVCQIEGDEEYHFLYVRQNHFALGPYYTYFCFREDLQMTLPSVDTVSSVELVYKNEENISVQVNDPTMIAALLEVFNGDSVQTLNGENWVGVSLIMQHKDFPFLQCEFECRYSLEQEIAYCKNKGAEWFVLPAEWYAAISGHTTILAPAKFALDISLLM